MTAPAGTDRLLTVDQVADQLGVHPETIRRAFRTGELKGNRNGLAQGRPLLFAQAAVTSFARRRMGLD